MVQSGLFPRSVIDVDMCLILGCGPALSEPITDLAGVCPDDLSGHHISAPWFGTHRH